MLSKPEITALGRRIKEGDKEAFHTLYKECFEPLQRYAMRYVYDGKEAEDMVQNAFFSLLLNLHKYDGERDPFTYLFVLVKNGCLNYIRKLKIIDRHRDKLVEALLFSHIEDPEMDPDIKERMEQILNSMSGHQQHVLLQHVVERKKMADIAHQMGVAESTVVTHFRRAMKVMRENLKFIILGF